MRPLAILLTFAAGLAFAMGDKPPPPPPPPPPPTGPTTPTTPGTSSAIFMSPAGTDAGACAEMAPCKTFAYAFPKLAPGGELVLLDGTYGSAINWQGAGAAQAPSGISRDKPTIVRAKNPGTVFVPGLFVGRSTRKDRFIIFDGITFKGGASLYNTDGVTLRNVGVNGPLSVGTNDHAQGNTDVLIEDSWVWAAGSRIIAITYRSDRVVWRRVVVRGDGCGTAACTGSGNPNVGITVYDSRDVSLQNVIVVDRALAAGDTPYADFACAAHTPSAPLGRVEWLGVASVKSPDQGFYCEPDGGSTVNPTVRVVNARVRNATGTAFNFARAGTFELDSLSADTRGGDGIRVAPDALTGTLRNAAVSGTGRYAFNSKFKPEATSITGTWQAQFNQTACATACGTGTGASDVRYGVDGSRFGDAGYNAPQAGSLWPWRNEARMTREMCATVARGFCKAESFTAYARGP